MIVHVIPEEGERVGRNEISENSSELSYHKKDVDADMSSYDRVINELKELYTSYIPTRQKMHEPVIKGNLQSDERYQSHPNHGTRIWKNPVGVQYVYLYVHWRT